MGGKEDRERILVAKKWILVVSIGKQSLCAPFWWLQLFDIHTHSKVIGNGSGDGVRSINQRPTPTKKYLERPCKRMQVRQADNGSLSLTMYVITSIAHQQRHLCALFAPINLEGKPRMVFYYLASCRFYYPGRSVWSKMKEFFYFASIKLCVWTTIWVLLFEATPTLKPNMGEQVVGSLDDRF